MIIFKDRLGKNGEKKAFYFIPSLQLIGIFPTNNPAVPESATFKNTELQMSNLVIIFQFSIVRIREYINKTKEMMIKNILIFIFLFYLRSLNFFQFVFLFPFPQQELPKFESSLGL